MTNPTTADLLALLRRAEHRERETLKDTGAESLGDLIRADEERAWSAAFGTSNDEAALDDLRSEADSIRANSLELKRALGSLSDEEEAERVALLARRTPGGYFRPADEDGEK